MSQAIILSPQGTPFANIKAAQAHLRKNENLDPIQWVPAKYAGGVALIDTTRLPEVAAMMATVQGEKPRGEESMRPLGNSNPKLGQKAYYRVTFLPKANPEDVDDVVLSINGDNLLLQRDREIILPDTYIEVAKNAKQRQWTHVPGKGRMAGPYVMRYPFFVMGTATEADFKAFMADLREKAKKRAERKEDAA